MRFNSGKLGWVMSATLHIGVALAALISLPHLAKERKAPPPPISIDFVEIAQQNKVVAPEPEPEEVEQEKTVEEQKPNYAQDEPAPTAPAEVVPLPEAKPKRKPEPPKPEPKPQPKPEVTERMELRSQVMPQSKPDAPSRLKSSRIAALIDKAAKEEQEKAKVDDKKQEEKKPEPKAEKPKTDMFAGLRGKIATATLMQALQQKVYRCWNIPAGAKGVQNMQVNVSVRLASDGSIIGQPQYVNAGNLNDPDRAFYRVFAESARRAVQLCAPYSEASDYIRETGENEIIFNFNPKSFMGG
ncbi:hypothetical protein [Kordiimonas aestuarii]|uniref:hypothetical protein n=1 Tax=Kordiimonas aestuarii TaxID=1005925 RepID=UPI0021CE18D7|nr:hypothetical protein [Kordiimonas aestuarii]